MKKRILKTICLSMTAVLGLSASTIDAKKIESLSGVTPVSKEWMSAKVSQIYLYPQTTITLNDKKANELNKELKAKKVAVRALYDGTNIAFLLEWPDGTKSIQKKDKTASYADGFAVEFVSGEVDPLKLPYIGMGSEGRPVEIFLQKRVERFYEPNGNGDVASQVNRNNTNAFGEELVKFDQKVSSLGMSDYQKAYISEGFRSMSEIKKEDLDAKAQMEYANGTWKGTLIRSLKDPYSDLDASSVPVAFAIWDGERLQRDGVKLLSPWIAVNLGGGKDDILVKMLNAVAGGDIARGKELAEQNCASCHRYEGATNAPLFMAPDLTNIGGYSNAAYLTESIVDPSAVVVPGYNKNAHKNFDWYTLDEKGKRVSTMPSFAHLNNKEILDIVAFLQTLKAEVK